MKIKTKKSDYESVMARKPYVRKKPLKTSPLFRFLLKALSSYDLKAVSFSCVKVNMESITDDEPLLVLMNHSSFIDLEIALSVLYPRAVNIVCEADGFIGKEWLMRHIGCIPTHKFNNDLPLVKDLVYAVRTLKSTILMYPEASYSFDGTSPTPLPESLGKLVKLLKIPVVVITTHGAFHRDPLYNLLRKRKVKVSAEMKMVISKEDSAEKSADEINNILKPYFTFDHFSWQKREGVRITEPFRAEGLESVLYKCPVCLEEGRMGSSGDTISCQKCGSVWRMEEDGSLMGEDGEKHIPSWFQWEREETEKEIERGTYMLDIPVTITLQTDMSALYEIGRGRLTHTCNGFHLISDDGKIDYSTSPLDNYSLASDIFWYEKGDMISIGDDRRIFYLFPDRGYNVVSKARFATEAIYRRAKADVRTR